MNQNTKTSLHAHQVDLHENQQNVFKNLNSYHNQEVLSQEFINKWVLPYYACLVDTENPNWIEALNKAQDELSPEVVLHLLGDSDWKSRFVGAHFVILKNYTEYIDIIGRHFLKRELCCLSPTYALVLGYFNSHKSMHYLNLYLDFYLKLDELKFEQKEVIEVLVFLDKLNETNYFATHEENWLRLVEKETERNPNVNFKLDCSPVEGQIKLLRDSIYGVER